MLKIRHIAKPKNVGRHSIKMKRNLLILLLIISSKSTFGQSLEWFTRNSTGIEFDFKDA